LNKEEDVKGRRIDICGMCGDEAEIAAHGLCYRCYRSVERACSSAKRPPRRAAAWSIK